MHCKNTELQQRQLQQKQQQQPPKIAIPEPSKKKGTFTHTTRSVSYLFNFDTKQIERIDPCTQIEFSKCSSSGLHLAYSLILNKYTRLNNYYIACPIYVSKRTKRILDTQLSVTGKCHFAENDIAAASREIQEELGITCNLEKLNLCSTFSNGIKTESTFIADVSDSRGFDPKRDCIIRGHDDRTRKIQAVICGKLDSLLNMYAKIFNRPESNDLETIRYVRLVSLKEFI